MRELSADLHISTGGRQALRGRGCSCGMTGMVTGTIVTRLSRPAKPAGLVVYSGKPSAMAVAAIIRSTTRPRGLRPAAMTAAATRPKIRAASASKGTGSKGRFLVGPERVKVNRGRIARHGSELPARDKPATPPERDQLTDPVSVPGNGEGLPVFDSIHDLSRLRPQVALRGTRVRPG